MHKIHKLRCPSVSTFLRINPFPIIDYCVSIIENKYFLPGTVFTEVQDAGIKRVIRSPTIIAGNFLTSCSAVRRETGLLRAKGGVLGLVQGTNDKTACRYQKNCPYANPHPHFCCHYIDLQKRHKKPCQFFLVVPNQEILLL